jgi:ABC-type uncharacterized transport system permease subunit
MSDIVTVPAVAAPSPPAPPGWRGYLTTHRVIAAAAAGFVLLSLVRWTQDADQLTSSLTVEITLLVTMPIMLAGLAGLWAERAGIVNIGIEGMMILGTWFGGWGAYMWGPWIGLLLAILGGAVGGVVHAVATVTFNVNHVISGVAINLLAFGSMRYLSELLWTGRDAPQGAGISQSPPQKSALPRFDCPFLAGGTIGDWKTPDILGNIEERGWLLISDAAGVLRGFLHNVSAATIIALLLVPLFAWVFWRTRFGLRVRSSGEEPAAAESLGVRVMPLRYLALAISGACAGFGGGFLSIVLSSYYRQGQTASRGFIGLATTIAGNWRPTGILAAGFLFGYPEALNRVGRDALPEALLLGAICTTIWFVYALVRQRWVQATIALAFSLLLFWLWDVVVVIPESLTSSPPYLITLIVLAAAGSNLRPPMHAGLPYRSGQTH